MYTSIRSSTRVTPSIAPDCEDQPRRRGRERDIRDPCAVGQQRERRDESAEVLAPAEPDDGREAERHDEVDEVHGGRCGVVPLRGRLEEQRLQPGGRDDPEQRRVRVDLLEHVDPWIQIVCESAHVVIRDQQEHER